MDGELERYQRAMERLDREEREEKEAKERETEQRARYLAPFVEGVTKTFTLRRLPT